MALSIIIILYQVLTFFFIITAEVTKMELKIYVG